MSRKILETVKKVSCFGSVQARQIFTKMYPEEEFLPRAPDPEEIILEGDETTPGPSFDGDSETKDQDTNKDADKDTDKEQVEALEKELEAMLIAEAGESSEPEAGDNVGTSGD